MRLTLVTYGSEGDTRPLVALARGLLDAGHEVRLFADAACLGTAEAQGVPAVALAGDLKSLLPLDDPAAALPRGVMLRTVKASLRLINGHAESWARAIAVDAVAADIVLYSSLAAAMGQAIAGALRKPALGLWLQPTTATREFAAPSIPPWHLTGWLNRLSYRVAPDAIVRRLYGPAARRACEAVLAPPRRPTDAVRTAAVRATSDRATTGAAPILYGFSPHLVGRPRDWPLSHRICGHWPLPPTQWRAPAALLEFLTAGPPPIYVGFGAMASFFRRRGLDAIAAALAGRRVVFFPGWSRIDASMLPANFFMLGDTPHDWLFPRTSLVMHHGGAGTTHTAARAGVPSVVLPVAVDQFFWAGRLAALGVAPPYVPAGKIDARRLAHMIDYADTPAVRGRARALGAAMAAERGVANAVRHIEALAAGDCATAAGCRA